MLSRPTSALLTLAALTIAAPACLAQQPTFKPVGLGGGGGLFSPAASPHNPRLMFVSCDMGGFYRSTDAGNSWIMLDKRQMRGCTAMTPVFHPTNPKIIYAWGNRQLRISRDGGLTWQPLTQNPPWGRGPVRCLAIDAQNPNFMLAGTDNAAYLSTDAGRSWTKIPAIPAKVVGIYIVPGQPNCFIATTAGIFRSTDRGKSWSPANSGLPWPQIRSFTGATDPASGQTILYCTIPSRAQNGRYVGGVFKSTDLAGSWQSAMGQGINLDIAKRDRWGRDEVAQYFFVATAAKTPQTVWTTTRGTGYWPPHHWTVFRSDDAGESWRFTFNGDPRFKNKNVQCGWIAWDINWGFGGPPSGFSVCRGNPNVAMYTNSGELFITTNGGRSWYNGFCRTADGSPEGKRKFWLSTGLNVTTCWEVVFDPHRPGFVYIAYTDIGFARSEDWGRSWQFSAYGSPWTNTFYRVIPDPDRPGVLYAACSNQHDIPHWTNIDRPRGGGGVCISEDYGRSWRPISQGLPNLPCTSIALDPKSPPESRTLYAAMFGDGVYKSTDGGKTWHRASNGLATPQNRHVYSIRIHPDGTLFCSITGKRSGMKFAPGSGLWRSKDGGRTWQCITQNLDLRWAGDFDFHPQNSNIIYLAAASAPGFSQGGLYKTTDGGKTWHHLVGDGLPDEKRLPKDLCSFTHAFFVRVDPENPNRIFLGATTHGLFVSEDAGKTWREVRGIPFTGCQRVTFDPRNHNIIWVTTFGGGAFTGPVP